MPSSTFVFVNFVHSFTLEAMQNKSPTFVQSMLDFVLPLTLKQSKEYRLLNLPEKESESNDTLLHFVEFSNVHNCDRSSNATRSNLVYKNV